MKKVGEFWLPDVDLRWYARWGKTRRKTLQVYGEGEGPKPQDIIEALTFIKGKGTAIDGGANVGSYTRIMAQHFQTIHAFEAAPDTYEALAKNVEEWQLADQVRTYHAALSDNNNKVSLGLERGKRSLSRHITGAGNIQAMKIDDLELSELDFIKLDVEGHELPALRGAEQTLLRCKPIVMFEDKGKSTDTDQADTAHAYIKSLGASFIARVGPGQFDWLYGFEQ